MATKTELNEQLLKAAQDGKADEVALLLKTGAEVDGNNKNGLPLIWAANNGHLEAVKVLLEAGADFTLLCKDSNSEHSNLLTAEDWARLKEHGAVEEVLKERRCNEVSFSRPLGNRTLEEIFVFSTLERISLIRKSPQGEVEAMQRQKFSEIDDEPSLRKAFNEHVRRGGKTEESRVFPNRLLKGIAPRQGR